MSNELSRRSFLKGLGVLVASAVGAAAVGNAPRIVDAQELPIVQVHGDLPPWLGVHNGPPFSGDGTIGDVYFDVNTQKFYTLTLTVYDEPVHHVHYQWEHISTVA